MRQVGQVLCPLCSSSNCGLRTERNIIECNTDRAGVSMRSMKRLMSLPFQVRNRHLLIVDLVLLLAVPCVTLALRTDGIDNIAPYRNSLVVVTLVFTAIKLGVFYFGKLYQRFWRYASVDELAHITLLCALATVLQTLLFFLVLRPTGLVSPSFPRSIPLLDGMVTVLLIGGLRYSIRLAESARQQKHARERKHAHKDERVLVVGAGNAGVMIVQEMQRNAAIGLVPFAFLDDDPAKQGLRIRGVPVLGRCTDIERVVRSLHINQVIIAMPTTPGKTIREIVHMCESAGVAAKIIPGMYELLGGTVRVNQIRDVEIEDLLRREVIQTDIAAVITMLQGKRVLVTGAGGSIGSELCRQILRCKPQHLILLGHGENSIFDIDNELRGILAKEGLSELNGKHPIRITSVVADIRSSERIQAVFREHAPQIVFHAAAHKHVPMMELNPSEAITNNILGTRILLESARSVGVTHFVMVSTDKAVNPTSMMGASKRAAELLVHQAALLSGNVYVAVRFGNVLASRGSVVPLFKKQIASGGPVTVTHPEMKRYFMIIPEAVQLVLQAAALGSGGEVYMLDMGEPVKIVDLAQDLIELSGLELGRDIDITFTGMRPGEKLFEELLVDGETYEPTPHEKIFLAAYASRASLPYLDSTLEALSAAAEGDDRTAMIAGLRKLVPEFQPVGHSVVGNGYQVEAYKLKASALMGAADHA